MLEEQNVHVEVVQSRRFENSLHKLNLSDELQRIVDDEIDRLIGNHIEVERKRGALSYLSVHGVLLPTQELVIGYSRGEDRVELHFLTQRTNDKTHKSIANR